jgi:hypothetical protein
MFMSELIAKSGQMLRTEHVITYFFIAASVIEDVRLETLNLSCSPRFEVDWF